MIVEDQSATVSFLKDPHWFGATGSVETIETHISFVFLAGDRAFKMKRAVKLPYLDFSTPVHRLAACRKELDLNGATTPEIYLRVRRITRASDGELAFDGEGELVDAVVEMRRFDQDCIFEHMADQGLLTHDLMTETARMIGQFHRIAPVVHTAGGAANIAGVLDINEAAFASSHVFEDEEVEKLNRSFREALARHADLLDRREAAGKIRRCHGDLHLRNICLLNGAPKLFDCIEFNERIASVDVLYDLSFLLMDLWHRRFREEANLVANRYLDEADDEDGFPLLPFFMALRAAVRAHVTATQIEEGGTSRTLADEARAYFELARRLLGGQAPRLVAVGGLSGTGKTTIAEALAPRLGLPPGARIVESDRIRKAMHGVAAETHLPAKAYEPDVSRRVYREMAWRSALILAEGGTVVADAVFEKAENRERIEEAARDEEVPFTGIWLQADPGVLWQRVGSRRGGPSDATVDVLSRQLERRIEGVAWHRIDASRPVADIVEAIMSLCRLHEEA